MRTNLSSRKAASKHISLGRSRIEQFNFFLNEVVAGVRVLLHGQQLNGAEDRSWAKVGVVEVAVQLWRYSVKRCKALKRCTGKA